MENNNQILKKLEELINKTDALKGELSELKNIVAQPPAAVAGEEVKPVVVTPPASETIAPPQKAEVSPVVKPIEQIQQTSVQPPVSQPAVASPQAVPPSKPATPSAQNNKVEKYIGENLINKIGIAVLVIGIGLFVKYAIDKNWINEVARVFIGVVCGLSLIAIAYKLRKSYKAFSSVLIGGGISVLYFTFTLAFREYGLINQTATFIIMILITAFTVFLALGFDRKEIAIIAIIGGFASPLLLSTGTGNYIVLFTYLLILNIGMLVLAYFKNWNIITIVCYIATLIFYGSWLSVKVLYKHQDPYLGALIFASCFYLVFFTMNIINNIKEKRKFGAFEIIICISNTFFYYLAGMLIFQEIYNGEMKGIFTAAMAVFHLVFSFILFRNQKFDRVLTYLMIGCALTFVSLIAPVQFEGNFITVYWAAEVALLFWISQRANIKLLKYFSAGILVFSFFLLMRNLYMIYIYDFVVLKHVWALPVILNKGFLTAILVTASVFVTAFLIKREPEGSSIMGIPRNIYRALHIGLFIFLLYFTIQMELSYQLRQYIDFGEVRRMVEYSFHALFFLLLLAYLKKNANKGFVLAFSIICVFITFIYLIASHFDNVAARGDYLTLNASIGGFLYHYINVALVIITLFFVRHIIKVEKGIHSVLMNIYYWYLSFVLIFIASSELNHIALLSFYDPNSCTCIISNNVVRIGYPVLWGVSSFILMVFGMSKKIRMLRIISLSIFFITLVKLFTYDIINISAAGKIIAFILLGILLLTVSFLYQKLKKILFEDSDADATQTHDNPSVSE